MLFRNNTINLLDCQTATVAVVTSAYKQEILLERLQFTDQINHMYVSYQKRSNFSNLSSGSFTINTVETLRHDQSTIGFPTTIRQRGLYKKCIKRNKHCLHNWVCLGGWLFFEFSQHGKICIIVKTNHRGLYYSMIELDCLYTLLIIIYNL